MTSAKRNQHRTGPGNRATRLDPYALDETTITLEEWWRQQARERLPATPGRRRRAATRPAKAA